jgi:uncharacterized protein (TIGR00369 family)
MRAEFEASYPAWERRVRDVFERQGAMTHIGARLTELRPGHCSIALPFRPEVAQHHEYFHAGMSSTIADSAGGYAALSLFPARSDVLTVEFKINLIAPARGRELTAEAAVVRSGRTLTVCTVDVYVERDGARFPCALMQQTLIRIDPPAEEPAP